MHPNEYHTYTTQELLDALKDCIAQYRHAISIRDRQRIFDEHIQFEIELARRENNRCAA